MKNVTAYIIIALLAGGILGGLVVWKLVPPQVVVQQVPTSTQVSPSTAPSPVPTPTPAPTPSGTQASVGACSALTVLAPVSQMEAYTLPIHVRAMVDNRNPNCHWTVFEAQAGSAELRDRNGNVITQAPLKTTGDWTSSAPLEYDATLSPSTNAVGPLVVVITEENPSGKPNPQTVTVNVNVSGFAK